MRQKPKSAQPAQSPVAPEQRAACRAPIRRAFRCVSGDLRQLDRPDVDHARLARHQPETNHLRRAHLINSWAVAEALQMFNHRLLQLRNTTRFLAQMLGVRRPTVTVIAGVLQTAGFIHYRRGYLEIIDRSGLEQAACECYDLIRQRTDQALPRADV